VIFNERAASGALMVRLPVVISAFGFDTTPLLRAKQPVLAAS
jgi:hypothetical protein